MTRRCSWCEKFMGTTEDGKEGETNGICEACLKEYFPEQARCLTEGEKMTYQEAKIALRKLAGEQPCSVTYRTFCFSDGVEITSIVLYIEGVGHTRDTRTYETAFVLLKDLIETKDVDLSMQEPTAA